jgi:large subunit ribosomal protein L13
MVFMKDIKTGEYLVVDAKSRILGRLASAVAKNLLEGKKVAVVNAEQAIITGSKRYLIEKYKTRINLQDKANPEHSPYWPRRPDMLVKRVIRGMLPYRKPRGKDAYRNLRVFLGIPEAFSGAEPIELKIKDAKNIYSNSITIEELSNLLGYMKK